QLVAKSSSWAKPLSPYRKPAAIKVRSIGLHGGIYCSLEILGMKTLPGILSSLTPGIALYDSDDAFVTAAKQQMAEAGDFKDHVFVFIHSFNTSFDNALYRTAQIAYDLGKDATPFGTAFLYSWPSAGQVVDYPGDFDAARFTINHLKTFLQLV